MCVPGRREDLKDLIFDAEDGDIERAPAEVVHEYLGLWPILIEPVGDGGGGGLIDDAHDVQARDGARIFCCLALRVVEVCSILSAL